MNVVTVSSRNQIAIPAYLLRELSFASGSKLIIQRMGDKISLEPLRKSVVDSVSGSLRKHISKDKLNTPWKKVISQARKAMAYAAANN
jgi:AbrB family looped-hinge helix DNA binding protein